MERNTVVTDLSHIHLTPGKRAALTDLLSVLAHAEGVAMRGAQRQATIAPTWQARRFLQKQALHEAFHARVFRQASRRIAAHADRQAAPPLELEAWEQQMRAAVARGDFAHSVLIQQVFLEGLGHVLLTHIDRQLQLNGDHLRGLRRLILSQEDEHHQFGIRMIEQVSRSEPEAAKRLTSLSARLFEQAEALLQALAEPFDVLNAKCRDYPEELRRVMPVWLLGVDA